MAEIVTLGTTHRHRSVIGINFYIFDSCCSMLEEHNTVLVAQSLYRFSVASSPERKDSDRRGSVHGVFGGE